MKVKSRLGNGDAIQVPQPTTLHDEFAEWWGLHGEGLLYGFEGPGLTVYTHEGAISLDAGRWIVSGAHGIQFPTTAVFNDAYERLDEEE